MASGESRKYLRRYTKCVTAATLFLVFAGAMVTSTGSGLAVPDWPLSYGMLMPPMIGGIFYEHGHRMIAATVGLMTLIQAFWLQRRDPRRFVRKLGWIALGAVIVQGLLGGITVLFLLPPAISIAHATLAEIFLAVNASIAFFSSRFYSSLQADASAGERDHTVAAYVLMSAVFIQILLGALMRHLGAGLAIPDFPLSFGKLIPPIASAAVASNFAHRAGALVVSLLAILFAPSVLRSATRARSIYLAVLATIPIQLMLGGFTVWTQKHPVVTSLHVVTGAFTFVTAIVFCLTVRALASRRDDLVVSQRESEAIA